MALTDPASNPGSFIFGGDTNVSYDELKRRRAIAEALASQKRGFPKNVGEGLTYLGESIGDIMAERRLKQMEATQRGKESGIVGGAPPGSFTPPIGGTKTSATDAPLPAVAATTVAPSITSASGSVNPTVANKPAMGTVGDAIGRFEPNPVMRQYYSQLAGREDPTGGKSVSPTGAAGPFQFTHGTGRQYGLVDNNGDRRTDVDASVQAAQALTRDNARAFININGRQPTLGELALMHQQGGVTGARMVAGTGNAPARNLAVNNIDPRLGPQDAAAKVQAYYKMPNAQMPEGYHDQTGDTAMVRPPPVTGDDGLIQPTPEGGGRDNIVASLLRQNSPIKLGAFPDTAQEVPQENPTEAGPMEAPATGPAGSDRVQVASLDPSVGVGAGAGAGAAAGAQPGAGLNVVAPPEAANNPPIQSDIKPAPTQVAEATTPAPDAPPSREPIPPASLQQMKDPGPEPTRPPILGPSKAQAYWSQFINNDRYSPELRAYAERQYNTEEAYRKEIEARQTNDYENARTQHQMHKDAYDKFVREEPDRIIKQLTDRTNLEKMRTDLEEAYYKQGWPRTQAYEKAAQDIEQGKLNLRKTGQEIAQPEVKEIDGVIYQRKKAEADAPAGPWEIAPGSPKKDKLTESQAKTLKFFQRATVAEGQLGDAGALAGFMDTAKGKVPIGGNYWLSPQYQKAHAAATAWTLAVLRDESGALIGTDEFAQKYKVMFPQPGDSPQVIADKAIRRAEENKTLHSALGDQRGVADAFLEDRKKRKTDAPDGKVFVNSATGKKARAVGGYLEPIE